MATALWLTLDDEQGTVLGRLTWPAALEREARAFITDNLLAERCGDSARAAQLLSRGRLEPQERQRFLAERRVWLPEPPAALAAGLDLEDLVAEFATVLHALRAAPPACALVLTFR